MTTTNIDKTARRSAVIPAVILSAFFGLAAGVVGMLMMLAYFPLSGLQSQNGSETSPTLLIQAQSSRTAAEFAVKSVGASSVFLFKAEDVGEITLTTKSVGAGVVLTSDGWLLTHGSVLVEAERKTGIGLVAVINGIAYAIEKSIEDPHTGVVFLKISGSELPAASFGQSKGISLGSTVFSFDVTRGLREATVIDIDGMPAVDLESAVRSSEKIQNVIRLAGDDGIAAGSASLNSRGEVIGIYAGESSVGAYTIPIDSFFQQISSVLRDGSVSRPYLGVRFIDLSEYPSDDGLNRGVRLRANTRWPAVLRNSPAAEAGLREGDIIKAVNDEQLTANTSLPDLLAEYEPGEKVSLTILRDGVEMILEVTLEKTL
ncbi:MAG: PDZ domain-containing protein [Patescibacteria group bacterium]